MPAPAENVNAGRNRMLSWVSGYWPVGQVLGEIHLLHGPERGLSL